MALSPYAVPRSALLMTPPSNRAIAASKEAKDHGVVDVRDSKVTDGRTCYDTFREVLYYSHSFAL